MQVIPVIDLLNGLVVHAVQGERQKYKPVQSLLCMEPDPVGIARTFRDSLGLGEIYIADLNAIQDGDRKMHRKLITDMAAAEKLDITLDAGISEIEDAVDWIREGIKKIVFGSETLRSFKTIREIPTACDGNRLVFSLDLKSGKILSRCSELAALSPVDAARELHGAGWKEIFLLDLARVGTQSGVDVALVQEIRAEFPNLKMLVGGGIAGLKQISELHDAGADGVLIATALHNGLVSREGLSAITARP